MLSNAILNALKTDSTDITKAAAFAKLVLEHNGLLITQVPDYAWKSLKTLLGATGSSTDIYGNPQWAKDHILAYQKKYNSDKINVEKPQRPIIQIIVPKTDAVNHKGSNTAIINIDVYTDPGSDDTTRCYNIAQRIKSRFLYNPAGVNSSPREFDFSVLGLIYLKMEYMSSQNESWDYTRLIYKAFYEVIEAIND